MRTETSLAVQRIQYMVNAWIMCVYSVQWQRWTCWWLFSRLSFFSLVWEPTPHPECLSSSLKPLGKLSQTHPEVCLLGDSNPKMLTMRIIHCKVYLRPSTGTHSNVYLQLRRQGLQAEWYRREAVPWWYISTSRLLDMLDNVTLTKIIPANASHFLPHQTQMLYKQRLLHQHHSSCMAR